MKIAFATTDRECINEHFGRAKIFVVYDIDEKEISLSKNLSFESVEDENEDRLKIKIDALSDCAIVYSAEIGKVAAARLINKKIHPMKATNNESIEYILGRLQSVLQNSPPPWLRKIMHENKKKEEII